MDVEVRSASEAAETLGADDCAVVVDALRASVTATALLEAGAAAVIPVSGDGADRFGEEVIKAGEHHGERIDGFDFGNSPLEIRERAALVDGETVVLRTTNGTRCVERVGNAGTILMGSLPNAAALVETCRERLPADARVVFVPAGRRGDPAPEDTYTAVALGRSLQAALGDPVTLSVPEDSSVNTATATATDTDAGRESSAESTTGRLTATATSASGSSSTAGETASMGTKNGQKATPGTAVEIDEDRSREVFARSDTGRFLASKGATDDVRFCARTGAFDAVAVLEDGQFVDGKSSDGAGDTDSGSTVPDAERTESTESADSAGSGRAPSHLDDVEDGCGCAEIWEHLSEQRSADR